jgi:ATP-dependent Lhr-like helicase
MEPMSDFHRLVRRWFAARFGAPTEPQREGWPAIRQGQDTLIAAPTGSGKTLAAFLVCIDRLLRDGMDGRLADETRVIYVSPLKALSNDVEKNLKLPLEELAACAEKEGVALPALTVGLRTGDTPSHRRARMLKRPPHILVTTPESLFLLLTGAKSREILRSVDTVIVDEIHALARDKRGSHLSLSLARLDELVEERGARRPTRIGLSATQRPLPLVAAFLTGADATTGEARPCKIVDVGHRRALDLALALPDRELGAICTHEHWAEVYALLRKQIESHRSTLVFVNTRKLAERLAFHLAQELGEDAVTSHHGSLSREHRLDAEERLKQGSLKAIVATASLELGIDVGYIDLVVQVGSPRSIATFLQRVGRAGHAVRATPKGRLVALTRDELMESLALLLAVRQGELDRIVMPEEPLDILAQQVIAAVATGERREDDLYERFREAWPYRQLCRKDFDAVLDMLGQGYAPGLSQRALVHRDRLSGLVRPRPATRITVASSGGAIPEQGDYRVLTEGDAKFIGTINEDFAIESNAGDIFLLGNNSWQVVGLRGSDMIVRDAHGAPPTIPFWLGEAPGRTFELSSEVSRLREELAGRIDLSRLEQLTQDGDLQTLRGTTLPAYEEALAWLDANVEGDAWAGLQAVHYVAVQKAALGLVPTREQVVFERFFDTTGGMQLVIHSPYGMRINKAWGLALRKRFCRSFDFELQASADNDGIVLSLGPHQSFPIEQLFGFLTEDNVEPLLEQALLQVPLFQVRWRWNTTRALAVLRQNKGKRVPPALQRFRADDLMTSVFPQQTMCKENVTGDIPIPDHPLVRQTMHDCKHEAMDLEGFKAVVRGIAAGKVQLVAKDTREPSPFSYQLLNAFPYAFLDDAPLEERRARAVALRSSLAIRDLADLTRLDQGICRTVALEAWPNARDGDELVEALVSLGVLPDVDAARAPHWSRLLEELEARGRAFRLRAGGRELWAATESYQVIAAAYNAEVEGVELPPKPLLPPSLDLAWTPEAARLSILRGQAEARAVFRASELIALTALPDYAVEASLPVLEAEGLLLRGRFLDDGKDGVQWCERRLMMRIHKRMLDGLRKQIRPVSADDFMTYLCAHQKLLPELRATGRDGALSVIRQLAGFEAAAGAWEPEILAGRVKDYLASHLDELTQLGAVAWGRIRPPRDAEAADGEEGEAGRDEGGDAALDAPLSSPLAEAPAGAPRRAAVGMSRVVPLALIPRESLPWIVAPPGDVTARLSLLRSDALAVYDALSRAGALFPFELKNRTGLLESSLEEALGELARLGLAHADGFAAIRPFVSRNKKRAAARRQGLAARFVLPPSYLHGGRWTLFPGAAAAGELTPEGRVERWAQQLLCRYGVVFKALLTREAAAPDWGSLRRVYKRMEARGEIRGGQFVAGGFGEQFALPEAVDDLRRVDEKGWKERFVVLSAADPLNLVGILTEGPRIPASRQTLIALCGGRVVALRDGGEVRFLKALTKEQEAAMTQALQLSGAFRGTALSSLDAAMRAI